MNQIRNLEKIFYPFLLQFKKLILVLQFALYKFKIYVITLKM